ncbi:FadR/GntR family transcriptional regulator [Streptomyces sp. NPDC048282]|uniref:FadR/GntR family transcriptional regulator n=1 Tax=Streptomyces sp. NPDC048282 TaxID=3365528 RepID=UPI00371BFCA2
MATSGRAKTGERASDVVESTLREQMRNGTYRVGERLPTQRALEKEFGVSRDTIQRAMRKLKDKGWVESQQGSGTRVLEVPPEDEGEVGTALRQRGVASLGTLIHHAFEQSEVTVDSYALTSETLRHHLGVQAERVAAEEVAPTSVRLRILLPAETVPLLYPAAEDSNDERVWDRWRRMARRHVMEITGLMGQLRGLGVDASVDIRRLPNTPQYKLYIVNESDLLFGPYEPISRTITLDDDETEVESWDVLGLGSVLMHYRGDEDPKSYDGRFYATMRATFKAYWDHLSDGEAES